jgi:putative membrane protein
MGTERPRAEDPVARKRRGQEHSTRAQAQQRETTGEPERLDFHQRPDFELRKSATCAGFDWSTALLPAKPEETLRLHQANERTMLAWIRTGIALMAFGFAIARFGLFLREVLTVRAPTPHEGLGTAWLGTLLVALGMVTNLVGTLRYAHIRRSIERGDVGAPRATLVYAVGFGATLIGLAMSALLFRSLSE